MNNSKLAGATEEERSLALSTLKDAGNLDVVRAVSRAPRRKLDRARRQRKIGRHVASMCVALMAWEGKGEAEDSWIHKTATEWELTDEALTKRMLKTAEKLAVDEGLIEVEVGKRPGDRQNTVWYRLNLWGLARVYTRSELANIEKLLERESRKKARDRLNKKRRKLENFQADMQMFDNAEEAPADEPEVAEESAPEPFEGTGGAMTSSGSRYNNLYPLQEEHKRVTSVSIDIDTPDHDASLASRARQLMNIIYQHLKDNDPPYQLTHEEYGYNIGAVKRVLQHHHPTAAELAALPEACREFVEKYGGLDVADALADMRHQAARSEREAAEARGRGRGGRQRGPGKRRWTHHEQKEGPTL